MSTARVVTASPEERRSLIDRFSARVDRAQRASPPTKEWVGRSLRREGAPRCPVRLKELSHEVILRYGDALADLFMAYPDDIVVAEPYDMFVGYAPGVVDGPIDSVRVLTEAAEWTDEWGTRWEHAEGGVGASPIAVPLVDWSGLDEYVAHRLPDPAILGRLDGALPTVQVHGDSKYLAGVTEMALFLSGCIASMGWRAPLRTSAWRMSAPRRPP